MRIIAILAAFAFVCVYGSGEETQVALSDDELVGGEWTEWLNSPYGRRYGDFESIVKYRERYNDMMGYCALWCDEPLALKYRLRDGFEAASDCVNVFESDMTSGTYKGFNCYNHKQWMDQSCTRAQCEAAGMYDMSLGHPDDDCNVCPDFEVSYYCAGDKAAQQADCIDLDRRVQEEASRELMQDPMLAASQQAKLERALNTQERNARHQSLVARLLSILGGDKK